MRLLPALVALMVGVSAGNASAAVYGSLVVFGDSLSDSGNNAAAGLFDPTQVVTNNSYVPQDTYAVGTYSNGPVWTTLFAGELGVTLTPSLLGGTNYAFGGAQSGAGIVPSLRSQASSYLAAVGGSASDDALYIVAGGGNDARAALAAAFLPGADSGAIFTAAAQDYAVNIGAIIDSLQAAGARNFLVWNTPNIGTLPAVRAGGAGAIGAGTAVSAALNAALSAQLASETGVTVFDLFAFGSTISAAPSLYGFANATDACGAVAGADCNEYVFWDGIHPTTAAHRALADANADLLQIAAVPEPGTWLMMIVGFFAVGAQVRRWGFVVAGRAPGQAA